MVHGAAMAMYIFAKKILAGEKISVYNFGDMKRDFTYIEAYSQWY